jgi:hypothetical protein
MGFGVRKGGTARRRFPAQNLPWIKQQFVTPGKIQSWRRLPIWHKVNAWTRYLPFRLRQFPPFFAPSRISGKTMGRDLYRAALTSTRAPAVPNVGRHPGFSL